MKGFDEYFGSGKQMEREFVMMTNQRWLSLFYSGRHKHRKKMRMASGGSVADTWK